MSESVGYPKVAVNVLVFKGYMILLGLRRSSPPMWSPPGGHLRMHEGIIACGRREVQEETGIKIHKIRILCFINELNHVDHTHYLNIFLVSEWHSGSVINGDTEDVSEWRWFDLNQLPNNPYYNIESLLKRASPEELRQASGICDPDENIGKPKKTNKKSED